MTFLVGRTAEQAELGHLVNQARDGLSSVLVVRGEAGIGKTSLLNAVASSATDFDVVRLVGIESEMRLGFAALHQLLTPFIDGIDSLPPSQAQALRAAFGVSDDVVPDQFGVGLAALTLLTRAAEKDRPLLIVVDDTQWLDQESADALGFLARQLLADPVCILASVRSSYHRPVFEGLPTLDLGPLSEEAASALLDAAVHSPLAHKVRARLLAEARGNPLALIEFGRGLSADQLVGAAQVFEPPAIDRRLERHFLSQVRALSPPCQMMLLAAAAEPTDAADLIWRAGRELDFDQRAIGPAQVSGLVESGPRIEFRHPLIRSAIYQGASHHDRCRVHAALAVASDENGDLDRRAWHRAAAVESFDDEVADELEQAARRARSRGSCAASADLLARAAQLTLDDEHRASRLLSAVGADVTAGNSERAKQNLARAMPDLREPLLLARARQFEAAIEFLDSLRGTRPGADAPLEDGVIITMMLDAARAFEPLDVHLARDVAYDAIQMSVYCGDRPGVSTIDVAQVARSMKLPAGMAPVAADLALDAISVLIVEGYHAAGPLLRATLAAVQCAPDVQRSPRLMVRSCWIAFALGDDTAARAFAAACAATSREQGAFRVLPEGLDYLGVRELRVGSLNLAEDYFTEVIGMQEVLRRHRGPGEPCRLMVSGWRGLESELRAEAAELASGAPAMGIVATWTDYALMILELGLGNYHAASLRARQGWNQDVMFGGLRAADAVEAHVRSGDLAAATAALEHLAERAGTTLSDLDTGLLARSQALLASDGAAEPRFRESVATLERYGARLHLARSQLVYGEWLRRQKRRRDARVQLAAALDTFASMGAAGFAERTRVELLATGATARKRVDDTRLDLTPQEWQIARMAAGGATNSEISARLFISASTVEHHLRKAYRKLDINSRHELARVVPVD